MRYYVLGYVFDDKVENFIGILKNKPASMKGKINGVGGKVEPGETPYEAMCREFTEEIGYDGHLVNWRSALDILSPPDAGCPEDFCMNVYFAKCQDAHNLLYDLDYVSPESEKPIIVPRGSTYTCLMNNVPWHTEFFAYLLTRPDDMPKLPIYMTY